MLGTSYQKRERERRRHQQRMEAIYAKREDICRNCAYFKDWRFCVHPKHVEGNRWADHQHVVGSVMVSPTQGCDLFDPTQAPDIRDADPEEAVERARHSKADRAIYDADDMARKAMRENLESEIQNKVGPIRGISGMETIDLQRLVGNL